ncbi:MarR family winged helix-turn-helix transcriptional regulator [Taibaiella soli]|uniref:MarR family winged helix-turn-helix transcriptional regulator n=1 Tax=Taibaiella soli TaxID=1649169 RepID=UPI001A9D6038|nr:MarR family transcriptional regulator [Taibaiella soli]
MKLLLNLAKAQVIISRKFDRLSTHGIGFSDFALLYLLYQTPAGKLRRIDLAEQTGLTASAVTRMLAPLEKIGLVARESHARDARVTYAVLTETGKTLFEDALVTANATARDIISNDNAKSLKPLTDILVG